jgi:hypothetical protein
MWRQMGERTHPKGSRPSRRSDVALGGERFAKHGLSMSVDERIKSEVLQEEVSPLQAFWEATLRLFPGD